MTRICPARIRIRPAGGFRDRGFTFTELIIAIVIMGLFLGLVMPNLLDLLKRGTFRSQVQDLLSTMQMAVDTAASSSGRYEVIIDLDEQKYLLREITSSDLSQVLDEEIITEQYLGNNCWISYVMFDDYDFTDNGQAKFRAGRVGWQYGGKIVLLDEDDQSYSIVVNRMDGVVRLERDDVTLMVPKAKEDVFF